MALVGLDDALGEYMERERERARAEAAQKKAEEEAAAAKAKAEAEVARVLAEKRALLEANPSSGRRAERQGVEL